MEPPSVLVAYQAPHPDGRIASIGFPPDHPYVEQCWSSVIGSSSTLLLRRIAWCWRQGQAPVELPLDDLKALTSTPNRLAQRLRRLAVLGLTSQPVPLMRQRGIRIDVYTRVPPLTPGQLQRCTEWARHLHDELFAAHLEELAAGGDPGMTAPAPAPHAPQGPAPDHFDTLGHQPPSIPGLSR